MNLYSGAIFSNPNASLRIEKKETQSPKFNEHFKDFLDSANRQQLQADKAVSAFLNGEIEDVHQVMIVTEEARLSLQLAVQVTNKMIEAYKDISRMQL